LAESSIIDNENIVLIAYFFEKANFSQFSETLGQSEGKCVEKDRALSEDYRVVWIQLKI